MSDVMIGYKGFDKDFRCRGMQYEVGKTYVHEGDIALCYSGFHFCEAPMDIWRYYPPGDSTAALVEARGVSDEKDESDTKRVCRQLTVKDKLDVADIVRAQVECVTKRSDGKNISSGNYSNSASSGNSSRAASSGYASNSASSGYASKATSSGDSSSAASLGERTVAMVAGLGGRAKAGPHGAIALAWLDEDQMRIAVGTVGENIKPDTWYRVSDSGELVEVE